MERPLLHQMVRTHGWAGLAEDSAASPGISTRGDPPTPSFHKEGTGKGKCDPEAPPLTGHNARCGGSRGCPGVRAADAAPPGFPPPGAAHTYLALGR